jgi:hypothetical protein
MFQTITPQGAHLRCLGSIPRARRGTGKACGLSGKWRVFRLSEVGVSNRLANPEWGSVQEPDCPDHGSDRSGLGRTIHAGKNRKQFRQACRSSALSSHRHCCNFLAHAAVFLTCRWTEREQDELTADAKMFDMVILIIGFGGRRVGMASVVERHIKVRAVKLSNKRVHALTLVKSCPSWCVQSKIVAGAQLSPSRRNIHHRHLRTRTSCCEKPDRDATRSNDSSHFNPNFCAR